MRVEIQVPHVPSYIPNNELPRELVDQKLAAITLPNDSRNGYVVSRYTTERGWIGFTVRTGPYSEQYVGDTREIDVDLADIYDYVTPAELERFEHNELEREAEREANRRKVGRPRKRSPSPAVSVSTELMGQKIKGMKPLGRPGRPPKHKATRKSQWPIHEARLSFAGVYVPSPVKAIHSATKTSPPSTPTTNYGLTSRQSLPPHHHEVPSASVDDVTTTSDTQNPMHNVDQLTPSNAKKVICDKIQPGPSKRRHRASYSMVNAALDDSETDNDLPQSPSEDELTSMPTTQRRRFSAVAEIAESVVDDVPNHISISDSQSPQKPSSHHNSDDDIEFLSDDQQGFTDGIDYETSMDPNDLLLRFGASARRPIGTKSPTLIEIPPPSSMSSGAPRTRFIGQDFYPRPSLQEGSASLKRCRPSLSPDHSNQRLRSSSTAEPRTSDWDPSSQRPDRVPSNMSSLNKTPPRSKSIRRSMTPHFPSTSKRGRTARPRMRGEIMDPVTARSPTQRPRRHPPPATSGKKYPLGNPLESHVNLPIETEQSAAITLGSPVTSSDESHRRRRQHVSRLHGPVSGTDSKPSPGESMIILGSPITSSSDGMPQEPAAVSKSSSASGSGWQSGTANHPRQADKPFSSGKKTKTQFGIPWR
ncbi:MAG: hypothetical protein Q9166_006280 [cf. Caloplaca sp. 2 TL-2023]